MKKIFWLAPLLISLAVLSGCELLGGSDTIILYPTDGSVVSSLFDIQLQKPASVYTIDTCTLYIDNTALTPVYNETDFLDGFLEHEWDSTTVDNGIHTLTVVIVDQVYYDSPLSNSVIFTVQN